MVISNYRFLETMGEGGESNPCYKPLYDETIDAPLRHTVGIDGTVTKRKILQSHTVNKHLTIGHVRNFEAVDGADDSREKMESAMQVHCQSCSSLLSDDIQTRLIRIPSSFCCQALSGRVVQQIANLSSMSFVRISNKRIAFI